MAEATAGNIRPRRPARRRLDAGARLCHARRAHRRAGGIGDDPAAGLAVRAGQPRHEILAQQPVPDPRHSPAVDRRRHSLGASAGDAGGDGGGICPRLRRRPSASASCSASSRACTGAVAVPHRLLRHAEDRAGAAVHHPAGGGRQLQDRPRTPSPCSSWCSPTPSTACATSTATSSSP